VMFPLLASRTTAGSPDLLLSHQDRPFTPGTVSAQILSGPTTPASTA